MISNHRRRLVCTCGWTYREPPPDRGRDTLGLKPFYRDMGLTMVAAGHSLLDAFQPGCHNVRVDRESTVTVTLELDTTRFDAALQGAMGSAERLHWKSIIAHQRAIAAAVRDQLFTEAWARYGWKRPQ